MPRANRLDRLSFGFLQNPDFLFLAKPTLLHFVLPFFFAQNSTFATSSFWGSGQYSFISQSRRYTKADLTLPAFMH
jgi:hypothetical protein